VSSGTEYSEGMGWRVTVSVVTFFAAAIVAVLWLFFCAGGYTVYQNAAVIAVDLLAAAGVMGSVWASWGMKQEAKQSCAKRQ